jgi:hypothetical protein
MCTFQSQRALTHTHRSHVRITDFLAQTFRANADKVMDVFVESKFMTETGSAYDPEDEAANYLEEITIYFAHCLWRSKDECEWRRRVRFHYADVRGALVGGALADGSGWRRKFALDGLFKPALRMDIIGMNARQLYSLEEECTHENDDCEFEAKQARFHESTSLWNDAYRTEYRPAMRAALNEMMPLIEYMRYKLAHQAWNEAGKREEEEPVLDKSAHLRLMLLSMEYERARKKWIDTKKRGERPERPTGRWAMETIKERKYLHDLIVEVVTPNPEIVKRVQKQFANVGDTRVRDVIVHTLPVAEYDASEIARGFVQAVDGSTMSLAEWRAFVSKSRSL